MKCPFCGNEFHEEDAATACHGCIMAKDCHMKKCPNCGYEIPVELKFIKAFKAWREGKSKNGINRKS